MKKLLENEMMSCLLKVNAAQNYVIRQIISDISELKFDQRFTQLLNKFKQ